MKIYTVKTWEITAFSNARKAVEYVKREHPEAHFITYEEGSYNQTRTPLHSFTTEKLISQLNKKYYITIQLEGNDEIKIEKMHVN